MWRFIHLSLSFYQCFIWKESQHTCKWFSQIACICHGPWFQSLHHHQSKGNQIKQTKTKQKNRSKKTTKKGKPNNSAWHILISAVYSPLGPFRSLLFWVHKLKTFRWSLLSFKEFTSRINISNNSIVRMANNWSSLGCMSVGEYLSSVLRALHLFPVQQTAIRNWSSSPLIFQAYFLLLS